MLNLPVEEIKKKIQEQSDLSLEDINTRVEEKMKQLSGLISEEGALHIIANELEVQMVPDKEDRRIKDLSPGMRDVEQAMRVVQAYELRTFESKFGDGEGKVFSFLAGDESGVIRVTCWGPRADEAKDVEKGDIVKVTNAYVKENNGRSELHLNNNSTFTKNPEGVDVAEAPERPSGEYERKAINELSKGDYRVELVGTIVQAYDPRFFSRKDSDEEGVVTNILIDDGTANVRVGCFDDVVSKVFDMKQEEIFANKDGSWEDAKNQVLGEIVKVKGRAKLNTVYNSIEVTADEIDMSPDAKEELKNAPKKQEALKKQESDEQQKPAKSEEKSKPEPSKDQEQPSSKETEAAKKKPAPKSKEESGEQKKKNPKEEPISLDDLDDLDFDDLE